MGRLTRAAAVTGVIALVAAGCDAPDAGPAAAPPVTPVVTADDPPARFGYGRPATHAEIAAWDLDIRPDGTGLPAGGGTAATGAAVYARHCASCHGLGGEGGSGDPLVGRTPETTPPFGPRYEAWRGEGDDVPFTVGNYWPFATTLYDYVARAMPPGAPGSLAPDEVYAVVAWILAENGLVARDTVIDATTLPAVEMPARAIFVPDLPD